MEEQPTPVFLSGESPWTEVSGGLQSLGSKRGGHDWATKHIIIYYIPDSTLSFFTFRV